MTITFHGIPVLSAEQREKNVSYSKSLGLGGIPSGAGRLAVVGSGLSLQAYEETLRRWDGAIWAINGAFGWLKERGIKAAYFSVHPTDSILPHLADIEPGDACYLADQCGPEIFSFVQSREAEVCTYSAQAYPGSCSASHAAFQAIIAGYSEVTFFGCDLSYTDDRQHIGRETPKKPQIVINADGDSFLTTPAYFGQAQELAGLIKEFPGIFRERSAGLLRAILTGPYNVAWASEEAKAVVFTGQMFWVEPLPPELADVERIVCGARP